ncbi:hypothetical protein QJS66_10095 [Kocuria rhizophila]|nr:hypothetical protein QJS66_10095 [Kocuria rhizophila]
MLTALSVAEHVGQERLATASGRGRGSGELHARGGRDALLAPGAGGPSNGHAGWARSPRTAETMREETREASGASASRWRTQSVRGTGPQPTSEKQGVASGESRRVSRSPCTRTVCPPQGQQIRGPGGAARGSAVAALDEFARQAAGELGDAARVTARGRARCRRGGPGGRRVESAPVHEQSAYMLAHSDNSLAETLARVAAGRSGREAGVASVQNMLPATLREPGSDHRPARAWTPAGVSGTGEQGHPHHAGGRPRHAAHRAAFRPRTPGVSPWPGAPARSRSASTIRRGTARGVSRAKQTGTLLDVVALTGYVQRRTGARWILALNGVTGSTDEAQDHVDRTVAELARTGRLRVARRSCGTADPGAPAWRAPSVRRSAAVIPTEHVSPVWSSQRSAEN